MDMLSISILHTHPREHRLVYTMFGVLAAITAASITAYLHAGWPGWGTTLWLLGMSIAARRVDTRKLAGPLIYGTLLFLVLWFYTQPPVWHILLLCSVALILSSALLLHLRDIILIILSLIALAVLTSSSAPPRMDTITQNALMIGVSTWLASALIAALIAHFIRQQHINATLSSLESRLGDLLHLNETILQNTSDGVAIQDTQGRFVFISQTGAKLLGYTPEELIGKPAITLVPFEEQEKIIQADQRRQQGQTDSYEIRLQHKDGHLIDVVITVSPYYEADVFSGYISVFTDISELKHAQRVQEYTSQRLKILHQIDRSILDARSPREIATTVLPRLQELLPAERASVVQYDFEHERAHILGTWEKNPSLRISDTLPLSAFSVDPALQNGQIRIISDLRDSANHPPGPVEQRFLDDGYRSVLNIPLQAGGKNLVGTLNLAHHQPGIYTQEHVHAVEEVAISLALAIQQALLWEAERRQRQLADTLRQATATLSESLNLEEVLQRILDYALQVIPSESANILSCQPDGFLPIAYKGERIYPIQTVIPRNAYPYLMRVLESGEAQIASDVRNDPAWKDTLPMAHVRSWMGIPLIVQRDVIGILNLHHDRPGAYTRQNIPLATAFAHQAALALHNARLFASAQQRNAEMEFLRQASLHMTSNLDLKTTLEGILDYALRTTNAYDSHIFLYDHGRLSFGAALWANQRREIPFRQPREDGVTFQAAKTGEKVIVPNFRASPLFQNTDWDGAIISLPLKIGQRVVGVMNVAYQQPHQFQEHEIRVLELLGDQAAIALENARLYTNLQTQFTRLNVLRTIDRAITGSIDLHLTLSILLDEITTHIDINAAAVWLLSKQHTLQISARRGLETQRLRAHTVRLGDGVIGKCALERTPIFYTDLRQEKSLPDDLQHIPYRTYYAIPLIAKGKLIGVLEAYRTTPPPDPQEWRSFLDAIANQTAIAVNNADLFTHLQQSNTKLTMAYEATLEGWAHALELRDRETEGHTRRVTELTTRLAQRMGIPADQMVNIRRGALLHDIGKMGISDDILLKPEPLSPTERASMQAHPEMARYLLSQISFLEPALDIPYCHHEKWDGSGYPRGLKGEDIPLAARIFAVVDVWDALTSDRPYRKAWLPQDARDYLMDESGKHFDPQVVTVFLEMLNEEGLSSDAPVD
ncbi:MAG: hypothetical protein Fur0018_10040 [Anaerolineales bacterium]